MNARLIEVTLGSGATPIASLPATFNQMLVSNNAAHVAYLGDSTVASAKGSVLIAAGAVPPTSIGPFSGQCGDASQFYLFGTQNDKIDVLLI